MPYDRSDYREKARIERRATSVRERLGLDQYEVVRPEALVTLVGATLFTLEQLTDDPASLRAARAIGFDGAASALPETAEPLIILNCGKPPRRQTATLMEELAHLILDHQPTRLVQNAQLGILERTFDKAQEHEAYDLGSAILLPKERIQRDVKELQLHLEEIADAHACSTELARYRVVRHRLWRRYQTYAKASRVTSTAPAD